MTFFKKFFHFLKMKGHDSRNFEVKHLMFANDESLDLRELDHFFEKNEICSKGPDSHNPEARNSIS